MAKIIVRGRKEPIEIENERAEKVKARWLGLGGTVKAETNDVVDLGVWAGEYGRIVEIEMTKYQPPATEEKSPVEKYEETERAEADFWAKLTPYEKSLRLARFKFYYARRLGQFNVEPPDDVMKKARELQEKFFTEHPEERAVPEVEFGNLLPLRTRRE